MIRGYKSSDSPNSLSTTKKYDGEDVKQQLEQDHHKKCYLCERELCTDFEIEHLKSQENYPELRQDWKNLLWSCSYCNNKKSNSFDNILNPVETNIEEEIKQEIDFNKKQANFTSLIQTQEHEQTCLLLDRLHNGRNKLRKKKEENFFEYILGIVNNFNRLLSQYLIEPTEENRNLIKEELSINKECLGFKYWIIKSHDQLSLIFKEDIIWNKK